MIKKQIKEAAAILALGAALASPFVYNHQTQNNIQQEHRCEGLTPDTCAQMFPPSIPQHMLEYEAEIAPSVEREKQTPQPKERDSIDTTYNQKESQRFKELPHFVTINDEAKNCNLSIPLAYSVAFQESKFDETAVSKSGAQGIFQLMPPTAKYLGVEDSFDPEQNTRAGVSYLCKIRDDYGFEEPEMILAAYNAGPGAMRRAVGNNLEEKISAINETNPKKAQEVREYVSNIQEMYQTLRTQSRTQEIREQEVRGAHSQAYNKN